jgi:peroxiredoxin
MRSYSGWLWIVQVLWLLTVVDVQSPDGLPPGTSMTPKARLAVIVEAQREAKQRYSEELDAAKGDDEVERAFDRFRAAISENANAALHLAQAHPQDPVAAEALRFIVLTERIGPPSRAAEQAIELLARDHIRDSGMGEVCRLVIPFFNFPVTETLMRGVLEKSPDRSDRGRACFALATYLRRLADLERWLKAQPPEIIKNWEQARGKEAIERLFQLDPDTLDREADLLLERVVSRFADVPNFHDQRALADVAAGELFARRKLSIGQHAPEIEGQDHEGRVLRLSDYRDKVVVLTFSGNWCSPCRSMYPEERELVRLMMDKPFALLSVNTDEDKETLRKSIEAGEITWRCWWDGGTDGPITTRWGISAFPTIYVLDRDGMIRFKPIRGEDLDKLVRTLLEESPTRH